MPPGGNVEEVVRVPADPVGAVVELDRSRQHEERLGHGAVKVWPGPAAGRGDVDAVEPVVAAGGLLVGQVVVVHAGRAPIVRRLLGAPEPGADFGFVFGVAGWRVGRHDK
jgi:hypothetical protein